MKLYGLHQSGRSHPAKLLLSLLDIAYEAVEIGIASRLQHSTHFLRLDQFDQFPVLVDGNVALSDSNAILVYLAKKVGPTTWLPESALESAEVQRWLSVAAGELGRDPATPRASRFFGPPRGPDEFIGRARKLLGIIDAGLTGRRWLASITPTIADVALYSHVARACDGDVDAARYPAAVAWLRRMESLRGFVQCLGASADAGAAR